MLKSINRRKPANGTSQQQTTPVENSSVASRIQATGEIGIEEEVDRLKRDKNILMQELVRLRQDQQSTDHQLQTVGQRVHVMEQHQQQMMSFLAKAMHTPTFLAQLVHQQNDSSRQISGGNKKRKLPNENEDKLAPNYGITPPDGQIIKFQPLMNEAAKAVLRQILIMNKSGRLESKLSDPSGLLIDNVHPPPDILDHVSSAGRMSGVSLPEAVSNSAVLTQIQSTPILSHENAQSTSFPKTHNGLPHFIPEQVNPEKNIHQHDGSLRGAESSKAMHSEPIPGFVDGPLSVVSDELLADDDDVDLLLDDIYKLPGINDTFWEQFLSNSPVSGDSDEIKGDNLVYGIDMDQETDWDNTKNLNNLTEQLALVASASKSG